MAENNFWLASNSPRRREILNWLDWEIYTAAANIDETQHKQEPADTYVMRVSKEKALVPIHGADDASVIIAADTIVVLDGEILGKPRDAEHAEDMLIKLRNRTHHVMTAIAVRLGNKVLQDLCVSPVTMRDYSSAEVAAYIASEDPLDKAGAYAIQNQAFHPARDFSGCFASVMGMPLCHLERTLRKIRIQVPNHFAADCQNHLKYACPITAQVMAGEDIG